MCFPQPIHCRLGAVRCLPSFLIATPIGSYHVCADIYDLYRYIYVHLLYPAHAYLRRGQ
eukprot:jgi/Botrbrau1/8436/Bobra.0237s0055.1